MSFIRKQIIRRRTLLRIYTKIGSIRACLQRFSSSRNKEEVFPRNEQFIRAAWYIDENHEFQRQSLGYFLSDPPRFVPCPHLYAPMTRIGMKGVEEMFGSCPWESIFFWAPFRNEEEDEE